MFDERTSFNEIYLYPNQRVLLHERLNGLSASDIGLHPTPFEAILRCEAWISQFTLATLANFFPTIISELRALEIEHEGINA